MQKFFCGNIRELGYNEFNYMLAKGLFEKYKPDKTNQLNSISKFNTLVIALTADAVAGAREKYINEGFTDYVITSNNEQKNNE